MLLSSFSWIGRVFWIFHLASSSSFFFLSLIHLVVYSVIYRDGKVTSMVYMASLHFHLYEIHAARYLPSLDYGGRGF